MTITRDETRRILAFLSALYTETMFLLAYIPAQSELLEVASHYFSLYLRTEEGLRIAEQSDSPCIMIDDAVLDFLQEYTADEELIKDVYGLCPEVVEYLKQTVRRLEGEGLN